MVTADEQSRRMTAKPAQRRLWERALDGSWDRHGQVKDRLGPVLSTKVKDRVGSALWDVLSINVRL